MSIYFINVNKKPLCFNFPEAIVFIEDDDDNYDGACKFAKLNPF